MRDECQHGNLRRQCEMCELIAERGPFTRENLKGRLPSPPPEKEEALEPALAKEGAAHV